MFSCQRRTVSIRIFAPGLFGLLFVTALTAETARAADWPMWRCDAERSAVNSAELPDELQLLWTRALPKLKPTYRERRLQFDAGYEPVVLNGAMFVASSRNDSVTALDVETGNERWRFFSDGPVRFAPVAWKDRVYFGSDDGHLYCLAAEDGRQIWKFRAAPTSRKVLGNGRLISLWPIRGGPVLDEGRIYFAAGVWSFEGVFVYCLDAETGDVIWRNDESGFVYGQHPHGAEAFGGVTPQGYLVINGDELIVPCGQALPARFDLNTGQLTSFELPKPGRLPGGWFASAAERHAARRGEVILDREVNRDLHEDKIYQGPGSAEVRTTIAVGGRKLRFTDGWPGVEGDVHSMLASGGKLFVVTTQGRIYGFGERATDPRGARDATTSTLSKDDYPVPEDLRSIVDEVRGRRGYAVVGGMQSFERLAALLLHTDLQIIAIDADPSRVHKWRRRFDAAGLYGQRIALHSGRVTDFDLPPYMASLLVVDDPAATFGDGFLEHPGAKKFESLRPFGGTAILALSDAEHERLQRAIGELLSDEFDIQRRGGWTVVRRSGPLPDSVNYTGGWSSPDRRVRAPLGVLWFDDTLGHFKRSPQPWFVDGVMISYPKDWMEIHRTGRRPPYNLLPPVLSDVYTGRVFDADEPTVAQLKFPLRDLTGTQPSQYRPPTQRDDWKPEQPIIGERLNPLTGEKEPRAFPKSYGCDGGVDYGRMFTMRSGTPAFYDKQLESGVCNISGPRSGCTNSIIPACGVLNVPYFYEGCTCSYPLPVGLALVSMPPEHEQWSTWGPGEAENIQRVGINLGAPGDRMTAAGTLWLDYPSRGGPSPDVQVAVEPDGVEYFYRHSLWLSGGQGWPWVAASGVEGARVITIQGLKPSTTFTVRLYFAEPDHAKPGRRVFDVAVNGQLAREGFDIAKESGGRLRSVMIQADDVKCDGTLKIALTPHIGKPLLGGIEIVANGLKLGEL